MEWIEELFDAIRFGCKQYKFMYGKGSKNLLEYKSMYEILSMIYWYLEQGNIWTMNNPTKITSILVLRRGFDKFFSNSWQSPSKCINFVTNLQFL